ncbi:hypothetical protein [Paraburkholderia azotifigens]|uniref:Uncharacterized protein n=1 Tax=Paraburkholderia azotifigens TaxID=2057004 RepID=A0A5C6VAN2_9BURK|nr:hypothetical protein [Paraburkholderia azotifigens]TXC80695.1 hypothetical protein FRZ40_41360 [Paraburkholderia azotifigens]
MTTTRDYRLFDEVSICGGAVMPLTSVKHSIVRRMVILSFVEDDILDVAARTPWEHWRTRTQPADSGPDDVDPYLKKPAGRCPA